ncbi:MAG: hypothetical protein JSW40_07925 [Candidatus Omnitrophota bacterium]|nr:MAG: hypothetical protein JSW40_07925 [Candidatus Omnitrophota bacterium]
MKEVKLAKREKRRYADRRQYLIAAVRKRRKKIREMALEYKGGRCERCGYDRCVEALEFHHASSSEKDFSVSSRGYTRSWKRVKEELNKCALLCANCHREIHAQVSSSCGKLQVEKASKFRGTLQVKGNPEPSPDVTSGKVQRLDTRYLSPIRIW